MLSLSRDAFYSPGWVADLLTAEMPEDFAGIVVDPTAGDGALLDSAVARFGGDLSVLATDIDGAATRRLSTLHPSWTVSRADFLRQNSFASTRVAQSVRVVGVDWVLLNPPFSYRGNELREVAIDRSSVRVARPIAFLWQALSSFNPRLGLSAVLPAGVVDGDRHQAFWKALSSLHDVQIVRRLERRTFAGAVVNSVVLTIRPSLLPSPVFERDSEMSALARLGPTRFCKCVEIIRGRVPMHTLDWAKESALAPFVHTSDLRQLAKGQIPTRKAPDHLASYGPLILIPRVGNPSSFEPTTAKGNIALSDCVFALRPVAGHDVEALRLALVDSWPILRNEFVGSGAPYLTVARLTNHLLKIGLLPAFVRASAERGTCRCEFEEHVPRRDEDPYAA